MKIIFLDIDGVLNNMESLRFPRTRITTSKHSYSTAHPTCIKALNHLTAETDARLVISSTWRGLGLKNLRLLFQEWGIRGSVIGLTPDLGFVDRGIEIEAWLENNQPNDAYVILDDGDDMASLKQFLVQTDYEVGLTHNDALRAVAVLNNPIGK